MRPDDKRELVTYAHVEHGLSLRRACQALSLSRSVYGYQPKESDDELVIEALVRLAEQYPRFGFGKLFPLVRREYTANSQRHCHEVRAKRPENYGPKTGLSGGKPPAPRKSPKSPD